MKTVAQKIILYENISYEQLHKEIEKGGRFVIYQYNFTFPLVLTFQRFSAAIFLTKNQDDTFYQKKYNRLSLIFGIWTFWGITYTIKSLTVNKKGGIDVTEDIMLNIDENSFNDRKVELKITNNIFSKPSNADTKVFEKTLKDDFQNDPRISTIYVALFVNTQNPYFVIGLRSKVNFEEGVELAKESLYKQFKNKIHFDFIDLKTENEVNELLMKQGVRIF